MREHVSPAWIEDFWRRPFPVTSLQRPDWTPVFDYEPAQAIKSRKAILDRVATDRVMVMGYHFPFPAIGHVVRGDTAYHWEAAQFLRKSDA